MSSHSKPTVIDLFAGAGLLSGAFVKEGYQIKSAVEADAVAARTYQTNVGDHMIVGDVLKIEPISRCDVLIAGPPCQGFSTLGKRNPNDPRNFLSLRVVEWVKSARPKIVIIENVAAFLTSPVWTTLKNRLVKSGYEVEAFLLNAEDFGVPQIRPRSFTIASIVGMPEIKPLKGGAIRTVREAWKGLESEATGDGNHYAPVPSRLALERMRVIPEGGDKRDVMLSRPELAPPSWWKLGCQVTDVWGRMRWDAPSNTLRTAFQNPSKGRYIHPEEHRVISLREAARLQTLPDSWVFTGLPTQAARQIGNGVPFRLGRAVARAIKNLL